MGVQGLWQLLQPAGKTVSPASLEGKVLAVDVSIWLHQTMKGMRDKDGNPLPNAHLQGLFSRVCKLLFYRIRPVFVFDGGVPALKKQTMAIRRERKEAVNQDKGRTNEKLLQNLLKSQALRDLTGDATEEVAIPARPGTEPDMFKLPPLPDVDKGSADPLDSAGAWDEESELGGDFLRSYQDFQNLSDVDFDSEEFRSLPAEIQHEFLMEMKEQRRENAMARIAIMPEESEEFSSYQLKNLIKKSKLTGRIESLRKEMNNKVSGDISYALGDDYYGEVVEAQRVVSEDAAHYILIKGLTRKQQIAEAERCQARRLKRETKENAEEKKDASLDEDNMLLRLEEEMKEEIESSNKPGGAFKSSTFASSTSSTVKNVGQGDAESHKRKRVTFEDEEVELDNFETETAVTKNMRRNQHIVSDDSDGDGEEGMKRRRKERGKALVTRSGLRRVVKKGSKSKTTVISDDGEENSHRSSDKSADSCSDTANASSTSNATVSNATISNSTNANVEMDVKQEALDDDGNMNNSYLQQNQSLPENFVSKISLQSKVSVSPLAVAAGAQATRQLQSDVQRDSELDREEDENFVETRNRLLTEEEELIKAKEAKMAALHKSLEKRTQNVSQPDETEAANTNPCHVNPEHPTPELLQQSNDEQAETKSVEESWEETREKLLLEEEELAKMKVDKMAALLKSVESRSQKLAESREEWSSPKKGGLRKSTKGKGSEETQGFLEDIVSWEQKAIQTKAKSQGKVTKNPLAQKSVPSSAFPELSVAYLEDVNSMLETEITDESKASIGTEIVGSCSGPLKNGKAESVSRSNVHLKKNASMLGVFAGQKSSQKPDTPERESLNEEESEDEGFIEITVNPAAVVEDELFPASIFDTAASVEEDDKPPSHQPPAPPTRTRKGMEATSFGHHRLSSNTKQHSVFDVGHDDNSNSDDNLADSNDDDIQIVGANVTQICSRNAISEPTKADKTQAKSTNLFASTTVKLTKPESEKEADDDAISPSNRKDATCVDNDSSSNHSESEMFADKENGRQSSKMHPVDRQDSCGSGEAHLDHQESKDSDILTSAVGDDREGETEVNVAFQKDKDMRNFTKGVNSLVDLYDLQRDLANERHALTTQRGKQARLGKSVTEQINIEAQELLQLFGIPYIVSPMEAEAQCAYLELTGLTQGTITDDSDSWLFGASNIYKNFFNQGKYVEYYSADSISHRFGLDRRKLINIALLCGSDYTPGIPGVGPVRAMEVLAEFPGEGLEGLRTFREWWEDARDGVLPGRQGKVKNKLKTLQLHDGFPSRQVVDAYLHPPVDESEEGFSWGLPDLDLLRLFAKQKFGWGRQKVDEVLEPMMKELTKKKSQGRIHSYFHPENFLPPKPVKSKRLQAALDKFQANGLSESESGSESSQGSESESSSGDSVPKFPTAGESVIKKAEQILTGAPRGRGCGARDQQSRGRGVKRGGKSMDEVKVQKVGRGGKRTSDASAPSGCKQARGRGQARGRNVSSSQGNDRRRAAFLREEVDLSESSSEEEEGIPCPSKKIKAQLSASVPGAQKGRLHLANAKPAPKAIPHKAVTTKRAKGGVKRQGLNVKETLPGASKKGQQKLSTKVGPQKRQSHTGLSPAAAVGGGSEMSAEDIALFKAAMGGDLDPQTMTLDDLGSDFSDEN